MVLAKILFAPSGGNADEIEIIAGLIQPAYPVISTDVQFIVRCMQQGVDSVMGEVAVTGSKPFQFVCIKRIAVKPV